MSIFVINREKYGRIVTLGRNRGRAMKSRSLPGQSGGLASMNMAEAAKRKEKSDRARDRKRVNIGL